jgi:tetratricopeptide (TPR) repeat protein
MRKGILRSVFLCCALVPAQTNYYTPENILKFADYLLENREYQAAVSEYQRLSYTLGQSVIADSLLLKIALCYQLDKEYDRAIEYYQCLTEEHPDSKLTDKAYYRIALIQFMRAEYEKSNIYINEVTKMLKTDEGRGKSQILAGTNYLYLFNWSQAMEILYPLTINGREPIQSVYMLAKQGRDLPYKSAALSGICSAVIPGSGKIYLGRKMDGLYSFVFISLLGYQTYRTFEEQNINSIKGWLYGSVTGILYFGNIYGSIVGAKIYNHKLRSDHIKKIELSLSW